MRLIVLIEFEKIEGVLSWKEEQGLGDSCFGVLPIDSDFN
jgi:hypothetical protein